MNHKFTSSKYLPSDLEISCFYFLYFYFHSDTYICILLMLETVEGEDSNFFQC